jgi:cell division protein ZapA
MSGDKAAVTVRIAGEEHTIRANAEPAYTKKCAKLVDDRIASIRAMSSLIEGHKAAILAALSIADEYFQAVEEAERIRKDTASRATNLAERIEADLGAKTGTAKK